jgi:tetratricopeptide (TPR) repeat protein
MDLPAPPLDVLDADELFMLGLRASAAEDGATALSCLKLAVARQPAHARAHWMLGAEYAALRMPQRAAQHFARAVALDPAQPVARFQYGLLLLTCGEVDAAESVWQGLAERALDDPLRHFANGLLRLARGSPGEALPELRAAARDPATPLALRRDVESVIARVERGLMRPGTDPGALAAAVVEDEAVAARGEGEAAATRVMDEGGAARVADDEAAPGVPDEAAAGVADEGARVADEAAAASMEPARHEAGVRAGGDRGGSEEAIGTAARSLQSHLALSAYGEAGRGRGRA